jgi:hypothetical protein
MEQETIYFCGLLANVDSSILGVKLEHNFQIEYRPYRDYLDFFSELEALSPKETREKLSGTHACYNIHDKKYYMVTSSFSCPNEQIHKQIKQFQGAFISGYLDPILRLMRLFQEGNILMPIRYYYRLVNNKPRSALHTSTSTFPIRESYILDSSGVLALNRFIRETELPFKQEFINLAFENFDLSYTTHNIDLSFLSLMSALEALLNPGQDEVTYRISRNTATLLGKDKTDSQIIFDDVRSLYKKRSKILHEGKTGSVERKELGKLRFYVRESIKQINKLNTPKQELMQLLNSLGFGQREQIVLS